MGNTCECSKYGNEVSSLPSMAMEKGVQYRGRSITIGRIAGFEGASTGAEGASADTKGAGGYGHRDRQAIFSFHTALRNGECSKVMYFMETFPDLKLLQVPSKDGDTCLQIAIENQSYKLIIYLLENGASPNAPNTTNGDTALHTAVRARDLKVAGMLSKYGAHSNVFNFKNETPFTIAAQSGDLDLIELLAPNTQRAIRGTFNRSDSCMSLSGMLRSASNMSLSGLLRTDSAMSLAGMATTAEGAAPTSTAVGGPFVKLTHALLGEVKRDGAMSTIQDMQRIVEMKDALPVLEGWLEKLDGNGWTMVWVVIKGSYLLWSKEQLTINDTQNIRERRQFDKYVNMMNILEAKPILNEHQNMAFSFVVDQGVRKRYVWRSMYEEDRDFWMDGLRKYRECLKAQISYLRD